MKNLRKVLGLVLVFTMIMSLAACGGKKDGTLSKDEYTKKVQSLYADMNAKGEAIATATTLQATDPAKALEDMKAAVEAVKPLYVEMGELKAPEEYADKQAKIKAGSEASIGMLDFTLEILELGAGETPDETKAQEKVAELQAKMVDWTTAISEMETTISELNK